MTKEEPVIRKVLIVEDDPNLARTYRLEFESSGLTVEQAFDGEEALVKAKNRPDLIILDIMLPKLGGFEVLKSLHEDFELSKIPVLTLTNFGSNDNIKQSFDLGAVDFVMKYRVTPDELVTRVKKILNSVPV
ncbi:MAG: response regulator transcription factor [Patescibacteria group bacterium]